MVSSQKPTTTPNTGIISPAELRAALIPAGSCGDEQQYPIQLKDGNGEQFDAEGVGADILDSRFVGAVDVNGDGVKDAVLVLNCTGTPQADCCAGADSSAYVVVVLDMTGGTPSRIGEPIEATEVALPGGDQPRNIDGSTVAIDGTEILADETLVYPDGIDDVAASEGWYRFTFTNGHWSGSAE